MKYYIHQSMLNTWVNVMGEKWVNENCTLIQTIKKTPPKQGLDLD